MPNVMDMTGPRPWKLDVAQYLSGVATWVEWSSFVNEASANKRAEVLRADDQHVRIRNTDSTAAQGTVCTYCLGTLCGPSDTNGTCLL